MFETITYLGKAKDCDYYHTIDQAGNGCGCVFVACTGSQDCVSPSMLCGFTHKNYDPQNLVKGDCKCQWLDQDADEKPQNVLKKIHHSKKNKKMKESE